MTADMRENRAFSERLLKTLVCEKMWGALGDDMREEMREDMKGDLRGDMSEGVRGDMRENRAFSAGLLKTLVCEKIWGALGDDMREEMREDMGHMREDMRADGALSHSLLQSRHRVNET